MTYHTSWRTEISGTLSSEHHGLRLVVQRLEENGSAARFLIFHVGTGHDAKALIGSGAKEDVQAAMAEAERMAERCAELGSLRARAAR
jgi:hypothetical protein